MTFKPTLLILGSILIAACAPFKPVTDKAGYCNELNSQIIFSGSTSDTRRAEIQDAEAHLQQQNFDRHCM